MGKGKEQMEKRIMVSLTLIVKKCGLNQKSVKIKKKKVTQKIKKKKT